MTDAMTHPAITEARAREYLAHMAFERAKRRHQRYAHLLSKWRNAKAELIAITARYSNGETK